MKERTMAKNGTTAARAKAAGAKAPADHQEKEQAQNVRVLADEVVLEWHGETYNIPRDALDDVEFVLELEQGKQVSAAVRLLGPGQWDTFKASHRVGGRVSMTDAEEFLVALLAELEKVANSGN